MTKQEALESYELACEFEGSDPKSHLLFDESDPNLTERQKGLNATEKLKVLIRVANDGKIPQVGERRYFPYFEKDGSGRWVFDYYYFNYQYTIVGSRLEYLSLDMMKLIVDKHIDLYNLHLDN